VLLNTEVAQQARLRGLVQLAIFAHRRFTVSCVPLSHPPGLQMIVLPEYVAFMKGGAVQPCLQLCSSPYAALPQNLRPNRGAHSAHPHMCAP
jgi:hypothetical protein